MNKKFLLLIPIVIILALLLAFCGKAEVPETADMTVSPTEVASTPTEIIENKSEETVVVETTEVSDSTEETETQETEPQKDVIHTGSSTGEESIDEGSHVTPPTAGKDDETQPSKPEAPVTPQQPAQPQSCGCEYERYLSMSAADQQAYMNSFSSIEDFISWSKSAASAHDGHNSGVTVEGGDLNVGDFIG